MFALGENAPVTGTLRGDVVELRYLKFAEMILSRPNVMQTVTECASGLAGRPVKLRLISAGEIKKQPENQSFQRLMDFGADHPDLIDMK